MRHLPENAQLSTQQGASVTLGALLGQGGQGQVYRAESGGRPYALKLYHPPRTELQRQRAAEQRAALLGYLVPQPPPDPSFLWPLAFVDAPEIGTFGYLMDLRASRFVALPRLITGALRPLPGERVICTVALNLARAFRALHTQGSCYKDINDGGVFFDPKTGDVQVCDCDNVRVNKSAGTIWFPGYGAPEVLRGQAPSQTNTDYHALAVLLFFVMFRGHPLEGRASMDVNLFDRNAQMKFYGENPVFIFDPANTSNRPVSGVHDAPLVLWQGAPSLLKKTFIDTFTEGLREPNRRPTDVKWVEVFSQLRDGRVRCAHCGVESFYDQDRLKGEGQLLCQRCQRPLELPPRIRINKRVVMLNPDTLLFPHHVGSEFDFSAPIADVVENPKQKGLLGLRNLTDVPWVLPSATGEPIEVPRGRSVGLTAARKLRIGSVEAEVRV